MMSLVPQSLTGSASREELTIAAFGQKTDPSDKK